MGHYRIGIRMVANEELKDFKEIENIFVELHLDTFEKRKKFFQIEEKTESNDFEKYLSVTTVTSVIS
jgi:hypothetical protein